MKFDGMNHLEVRLVKPNGKPVKELKHDKYKEAKVIGVRRLSDGGRMLRHGKLELTLEVDI